MLVVYIPVKSYNVIFKTQNLKGQEFQKRYRTLIMDIRIDNPLRYQFITVFLFRRVLYAGVFLFFTNFHYIQVSSSCLIVIAMEAYLLIIKPYGSILSRFLSTTNEFLLLASVAIPGRFLEPIITPSSSKVFGNLLISIIISTIAINWVSIIIYGTTMYIRKKAIKAQKNMSDSKNSKPR